METLVTQGVDGLVVVGTTIELSAVAAASATVPTVLAGAREPDLDHIDIAVKDDYAGGSRATEHLIALGHRRIAHLRGPGLIGDLRQPAITTRRPPPSWIPRATASTEETARTAGTPPRGDFSRVPIDQRRSSRSMTSPQSLPCLPPMTSISMSPPTFPSGYDNTCLSRIRHLSLTSIDNGNFAVGVQAAKFLLERIDNPRLPQRMYFFDPQLHIRRSTQAPLAT